MNIAGVDYESVKDGIGVRTVIYTSGCSHNCPMCHNHATHDPNYGITFTEEMQEEILKEIKKRPFVSGLTWSGGDPLHENNLKDVLKFSKKFRALFPEKTIWLYTGYTWEKIINHIELNKECDEYGGANIIENQNMETRKEILLNMDVIVDGRYIDSQRDITLKWRGSKNQRVIDVKKTLDYRQIMLYCD